MDSGPAPSGASRNDGREQLPAPPAKLPEQTPSAVGGLAQRLRAKRGPMTSSGVIRHSIAAETADYAFRLRSLSYGGRGRLQSARPAGNTSRCPLPWGPTGSPEHYAAPRPLP